jgi:glycosyltransferase involved in cell wall biosynthesis
MSLPTVSVIIPSFNLAHYLPLAIESALEQTHQPLEIIVVDDASTDQTSEVVRRFGDKIKYLVHSTNRYAAAARNTGLRASSGELIAFLDGDDRYHPEKLATQASFLQDSPDVCLTFNHRV